MFVKILMVPVCKGNEKHSNGQIFQLKIRAVKDHHLVQIHIMTHYFVKVLCVRECAQVREKTSEYCVICVFSSIVSTIPPKIDLDFQ